MDRQNQEQEQLKKKIPANNSQDISENKKDQSAVAKDARKDFDKDLTNSEIDRDDSDVPEEELRAASDKSDQEKIEEYATSSRSKDVKKDEKVSK